MRTSNKVLAVALSSILASFAVVTTARAATGCQVTYQVSSQWTGGFSAAISIRNLGAAATGGRGGTVYHVTNLTECPTRGRRNTA